MLGSAMLGNHICVQVVCSAMCPSVAGLGKNERLLQSAPQSSSSIAHLLQAQQFNQQARALGQQNASGLSNGLYNLQQQQVICQIPGLIESIIVIETLWNYDGAPWTWHLNHVIVSWVCRYRRIIVV